MDVANHGKQISLSVDEPRVVTAFKKMPRCLQSKLYGARVPARNSVDNFPERPVGDLYQEVNVIGHPAIGMDSGAQGVGCFSHHCRHEIAIRVSKEDRLAVIAPERDVVEASRHVQTKATSH